MPNIQIFWYFPNQDYISFRWMQFLSSFQMIFTISANTKSSIYMIDQNTCSPAQCNAAWHAMLCHPVPSILCHYVHTYTEKRIPTTLFTRLSSSPSGSLKIILLLVFSHIFWWQQFSSRVSRLKSNVERGSCTLLDTQFPKKNTISISANSFRPWIVSYLE